MRKHCSICSMIYFLTTISLFAQPYKFKTYTVNDGLVHNSVRKIYQDKKGFLWIGTWEGLSKYDGHRFKNYTSADGMSNDFINDLLEGPDETMIAVCNDGSFYSIAPAAAPQKILNGDIVVNNLFAVGKNKLLALTDYNGIYEWKNNRLQKEPAMTSRMSYSNMSVLNDSLLVALSNDTVQILNHQLQIVAQLADTKTNYYGCGVLKDSKDRCWVGTNVGLKLLSPVQVKGTAISFAELPIAFRQPLLQTMQIRTIVEDEHQNLWFGTSGGLIRVGADGSSDVITAKNGLPVSDVQCLYLDREQNLWIGGSGGLSKLVSHTQLLHFAVDERLASNHVYHLMPLDNGDMVALTDEGEIRFSNTTNRFLPVVSKNQIAVSPQLRLTTVMIKGTKHRLALYANKHGKPLSSSGTYGPGYYAFQDEAGNFFSQNQTGVGFSADLLKWDILLYHGDCRAVMLDTKGHLWVGTYKDGLLRISYRYQNGTPQLVAQKQFLKGISIRSLFEDSKGCIWAGSRYHGVFRISADDRIKQYGRAEGITSNRIMGIAEDKKGAIWLNFYYGLDKLVPQGGGYRVFNFSRVHNFFPDINSIVVGTDNTLWVATTQTIIRLVDGEAETLPPVETFITSAIFGDRMYNPAAVRNLSLDYSANQAQFTFAAPGFLNEKQTLYSYRLLGGNHEEWSKPSNEYQVSFASLRPGNYRFEVRSLGYNNQWGQAAFVSFIIRPPFWLSWGFIAVLGMLGAAAIYFFVRRRIHNVRNKAEMKQRIAEAEVSALRAQMNPHFIFNCLSAIDNMIETDQKEKATTYLNRFARLIRNVLDSSKKTLVPLHADVETLSLYLELERFRCDDKFNYTLTADPQLLQGDYKVPPLVVQPFVENAIHHGLLNRTNGEGQLKVSISAQANKIVYCIEDNGVGRLTAAELKNSSGKAHTSYGMAITEDRIRMFNDGDIAKPVVVNDLYNNGQPSGTRVEVFLKAD